MLDNWRLDKSREFGPPAELTVTWKSSSKSSPKWVKLCIRKFRFDVIFISQGERFLAVATGQLREHTPVTHSFAKAVLARPRVQGDCWSSSPGKRWLNVLNVVGPWGRESVRCCGLAPGSVGRLFFWTFEHNQPIAREACPHRLSALLSWSEDPVVNSA